MKDDSQNESPASTIVFPVNLPLILADIEKMYVQEALKISGGSKKEAARLLGIGRTTLVEKLRRREAGLRRNTTYTPPA